MVDDPVGPHDYDILLDYEWCERVDATPDWKHRCLTLTHPKTKEKVVVCDAAASPPAAAEEQKEEEPLTLTALQFARAVRKLRRSAPLSAKLQPHPAPPRHRLAAGRRSSTADSIDGEDPNVCSVSGRVDENELQALAPLFAVMIRPAKADAAAPHPGEVFLMNEYGDVFQELPGMPPVRSHDHKIELLPGSN